MKRPVLHKEAGPGTIGTLPAELDRKRRGWRCPFCPRRGAKSIKPEIGAKCAECGARVVELEAWDPFASRRSS